MKDIKTILLLIFASAVVIFLVSHLLKGDEEMILEQLSALEEIVYLEPGEAPLAKATRLKQAAQFFTQESEIQLDLKYREEKLIRNRQDLTDSLLFISQRLEIMSIEFNDSKVELAGTQEARVETTVKVTYEEKDLFQVVEFEIGFVKTEDEWLIRRVRNVNAIEF